MGAVILGLLAVERELAASLWGSVVVVVALAAVTALGERLARFGGALIVLLGGAVVIDAGLYSRGWNHLVAPHRTSVAVVLVGLVAATAGGVPVIEAVIGRIRGLPSPEAAERPTGAPAGGRVIGVLERALVFGAVLLGHPEAVALVVGLKSIARFPEFDENRPFAEYFVIGTFVSLIWALSLAYFVRAGVR